MVSPRAPQALHLSHSLSRDAKLTTTDLRCKSVGKVKLGTRHCLKGMSSFQFEGAMANCQRVAKPWLMNGVTVLFHPSWRKDDLRPKKIHPMRNNGLT